VHDHKGHRVGDVGENKNVKVFQRRAQILKKKIDASQGETEIFTEELEAIEDQLQVSYFVLIVVVGQGIYPVRTRGEI